MDEKLKKVLKNRTVSILGDSISTFINVSNNINKNESLLNNKVYYDGVKCGVYSINQTWWQQLINDYELHLLINNSWSGSKVLDEFIPASSYYSRCKNLHAQVGEYKDIDPDIIFIYMGTNDVNCMYPLGDLSLLDNIENNEIENPKNFIEAYCKTLKNIKEKYKTSSIFVLNILPQEGMAYLLTKDYNYALKKICSIFDVNLVDLFNKCQVSLNPLYFGDEYMTHPNARGMLEIRKVVEKTLIDYYL